MFEVNVMASVENCYHCTVMMVCNSQEIEILGEPGSQCVIVTIPFLPPKQRQTTIPGSQIWYAAVF